MKLVTVEVDSETAKRVLAEFENQISEKIRSRDQLDIEISTLEDRAKSVRAQLQNGNGEGERQPRGQNKSRILDYLAKLPDNKGARLSEISKSMGISISSTAYTLKKNPKDFAFDEDGKLWKLKR